MKATGIVRKIDELGRVLLPAEVRRPMEIGDRDALEIFTDGDTVVLKKYAPSCVFCGEARDVTTYKGRNICTRCAQAIATRVDSDFAFPTHEDNDR